MVEIKTFKASEAEPNTLYWSINEGVMVEALYSTKNGGVYFWAFKSHEKDETAEEIYTCEE